MSHPKLVALTRIEQAHLDHHVETIGEELVADAAGTARLTIARARLGCRLQTPSREKIRAYLHGTPLPLAV